MTTPTPESESTPSITERQAFDLLAARQARRIDKELRSASLTTVVTTGRTKVGTLTKKERHRRKVEERHLARELEKRETERRTLLHAMHNAPGASTSHRGSRSTWAVADSSTVKRAEDAPTERVTDGRVHPVTVTRDAS